MDILSSDQSHGQSQRSLCVCEVQGETANVLETVSNLISPSVFSECYQQIVFCSVASCYYDGQRM